ncbi:hypothetical protein ASG82_12300 [Mycobacterium sp. Soil538]|nr:hypothetical protein ASG82_12300 [Mycobacterium sp. Soil538]
MSGKYYDGIGKLLKTTGLDLAQIGLQPPNSCRRILETQTSREVIKEGAISTNEVANFRGTQNSEYFSSRNGVRPRPHQPRREQLVCLVRPADRLIQDQWEKADDLYTRFASNSDRCVAGSRPQANFLRGIQRNAFKLWKDGPNDTVTREPYGEMPFTYRAGPQPRPDSLVETWVVKTRQSQAPPPVPSARSLKQSFSDDRAQLIVGKLDLIQERFRVLASEPAITFWRDPDKPCDNST